MVLWVSVGVRAFGEVVSGQAPVRSSIENMLFELIKVGGNKEVVVVRHPHPDMDEDTWAKFVTCLLIQNMSGYEDVCSISKSVGNFPSVTSEIGPAELYAASHKRKNGDWLSDVAKDNHVNLLVGVVLVLDCAEKMRELQEQAISDGRSYTDIDILHQVLGPKPGYVRGWGEQ
ncbi:hypothetical protein CJ030_MR5G025001 [Morella rubra]|uniref:Uncharacterized protein n=1 Tax=Morella rubra TaxID=262757 RepID=A0A6A1VHU0_9ROSI|nr:hypothetical protein CJ030_MR5G025001 [Morella rubra]